MTPDIQSEKQTTWLIAIFGLLTIFPPLATDMYLSAIGDLAVSMQASKSAAELSLSLFFLGLCLGQLVVGPLIDVFGRKGPLLIGIAIYIATSFALAMTSNIYIFDGLRVLQAIGACAGMVVGRAIVSDLYEGQQAAKVMTVLVMMLTIGPIVSPTLGSLLHLAFGWRSIFALLVLIGLVSFALALRYVPETLPPSRRRPGSVSGTASAFGNLLSNRRFVTFAVIGGLVQAGMFAFITGSSGVFQTVFGLTSLQFGLVFALIAAALIVFGQVNKMLLNTRTPESILKSSLWLYVAAGVVLVVVSRLDVLWALIGAMWVAIGLVGMVSANAMALAMGAGKASAGIASAALGAVQFVIAFAVSTSVALSDAGSATPMALGIVIPGLCAAVLFVLSNPYLGIKAHQVEQ